MSKTAGDLGTGRASLGAVLDFAWTTGAFTATDAMAAASLTRSTTIDAIDSLVAADVLRELPNARAAGQYRAGRPARRFELPADLGMVAGLDAGDTHLTLRIADLGGRTVWHRRVTVDPAQTIAERQKAILEQLDTGCAERGIAAKPLLSICVGVAAPVSRDGQSPPHPEGFWERTNAGLVHLLADRAEVVEVKNDAQLAAAAEGALGAAVGSRDYIALLAGERLGAGVVVDGHLLHGAHGGVGEMFAFDFVRGVDSAFGLGPVIERRAREMLADGTADPAGRLAALAADELDPRRILALAAAGDDDALRIAAAVGEAFARMVGVLGSMFDPEQIIVCGAIAEGIEPVLEAARRSIAPYLHLPAPVLIPSRLGGDIVTQGAVSRALQNARHIALPALAERRLRDDPELAAAVERAEAG
ncbi:ROK family protein [Microbacterium hominis]|uniref:ROK family protein n=1 Tax=Microbacterium hominis TaxID=162426 RepID=A0A7D4TST5_9MICO|nr:ROK family protein [Microbacterium hominis]QKJ20964.1 ROK family protein [Microbacterium hominis]